MDASAAELQRLRAENAALREELEKAVRAADTRRGRPEFDAATTERTTIGAARVGAFASEYAAI